MCIPSLVGYRPLPLLNGPPRISALHPGHNRLHNKMKMYYSDPCRSIVSRHLIQFIRCLWPHAAPCPVLTAVQVEFQELWDITYSMLEPRTTRRLATWGRINRKRANQHLEGSSNEISPNTTLFYAVRNPRQTTRYYWQ